MDAGTSGEGGPTSDERRELAELRRENRRLRGGVDILKRACERLEVSRSRKRAARLMRDQGLRGRAAKRWKIA